LNLLDAIRLQDLDEELSVVLFFQVQVTLLVSWIGEVLRQFLDLLRKVLETAQVLLLGPDLLGRSAYSFYRLAVRSVLHSTLRASGALPCLAVSGRLLCLLGILVFLEVLLSHLPLDDHETGVDEGLLEELALEHADEVFDPDVLSGGSLDDAAVCLDLLLLGKSLLWVGLRLLCEGSLVLLEELLRFFEGVLRVLTIDALVVELCGGSLHLREHLQHVLGVELAGSNQSQEEASVRCEGAVEPKLHHE
jgi:hypothetical protein